MVWGVFSMKDMLWLTFPSKRMDSNEHMDVSGNSFVRFWNKNKELEYTFQQDNAPNHTSEASKNGLRGKEIYILEWPSSSPDLNPMENT